MPFTDTESLKLSNLSGQEGGPEGILDFRFLDLRFLILDL